MQCMSEFRSGTSNPPAFFSHLMNRKEAVRRGSRKPWQREKKQLNHRCPLGALKRWFPARAEKSSPKTATLLRTRLASQDKNNLLLTQLSALRYPLKTSPWRIDQLGGVYIFTAVLICSVTPQDVTRVPHCYFSVYKLST